MHLLAKLDTRRTDDLEVGELIRPADRAADDMSDLSAIG